MKNNENIDKEQNINKKQIIIFDEHLEYIDFKEIELLTNKIQEISPDSYFGDSNQKELSSLLQKNVNHFPYYIGSFKYSLNRLLRNNKNKDLNNLYEAVLKEIKKVYYGYTHVEQKMYNKINKYIKFKESENNSALEIITKLKEIGKTLEETIKFVEVYLYINFKYLKTIFKKIDKELSKKIGIKSVSLYFLLDIFELPNNELSYIMMFKIIDEVSCILKYITDELSQVIENQKENPINNSNNNVNIPKDKQSNLLDDKSLNTTIAINASITIKDKYVKKIYELLDKLDEYNIFRAKYYNKYLYTKGNFVVDTNRFINDLQSLDSISEEFLQINTLMDEELIINKFLDKPLINEFLNYFEEHLPLSYKRNLKLIYLHLIFYNIISIITIYSFFDYFNGFIEAIMFFIGKIIGKILFNYLLKKRNKMKLILLISNFILLISLIISIFDNQRKIYILINYISKLIVGISCCKNIETRFIIYYTPKLLIKRNIKKYFRIKYISIALGFFILTGFSYLQALINNNQIKIDIIIIAIINLIIMILNFLLFKEPKFEDIFDSDINEPDIDKSQDKGIEEKENIIESSIDKKLNTSENIVNISYGKAKMISLKERNKVKILESNIKLGSGKDNYEGTNHIFSILQDLIINENFNKSSYSNFSTIGHIIFLAILYIIFSIILFYNPLINTIKANKDKNSENFDKILNFKKETWIFGVSYLLFYFSLKFKFFSHQKKLSSWNLLLLLFLCFQILLALLFLIFENNIFFSSPISFDNHSYISCYSALLLFSLFIEKICLKIMIREIPLEISICTINIDNFLDLYENFIKALIFTAFYIFNYFIVFQYENLYIIVIIVLFVVDIMIFLIFNYKRKQYSLIKIINKVTYESF